MSAATGANDNGSENVGGGSPRNCTSQQGRGGNRGRFNRKSDRERSQRPQPKRFTGKEDGLGDQFVYQHTEGRDTTDQHAKTTEEIIRYSSTKHKNGGDMERSLADGAMRTFAVPTAPTAVPPDRAPEGDMMTWKMRAQSSLQKTSFLASNLESVHALIKGQCSKPMLEKVEAMQGHAGIHQGRKG